MRKIQDALFLIAYLLSIVICIAMGVMYIKFILESDIPEWLKFILIR